MKLILIATLLFLLSCQSHDNDPVRVAGVKKETKTEIPVHQDSQLMQEQDIFSLWLTKTYYALKHDGLSNKKAWLQIDSLTKLKYKGAFPYWYPKLKQESDSLMKEKNKYKRVRIV